jgi:hypothetical protein
MQNVLKSICELDKERSKNWDDYYDLFNKLSKEKDKTFKSLVEEFNKHEKFTSKYKKLKDIDELTWQLYHASLDGLNLWVEDDHLFTLNNKLCSTAHVTRTKGAKISATNDCSLCLESHDLRHLVKTSCGHYFGKKCFAALLKNRFEEHDSTIKCPNCRNDGVTLQQFKYKK